MNRGEVKVGAGRTIGGIALGVLLAVASPVLMMLEVFSLVSVIMLPSIALIALYRWAGRGPAILTALLMLAIDLSFMGFPFMLMAFAATIVPPLALLRWDKRPFFQQLRLTITAFGLGVLTAVAVLYLSFGRNMIERILEQLPKLMRMQSAESLAPALNAVSGLLRQQISVEDFYSFYDSAIAQLIPVFQLRLPELLFSGALISALVCVWLSNRMAVRRGTAAPGSFQPLREWALPASTTGGLLLMLAASGVLRLFKVASAETLFNAVYGIAVVAFCTQALGSISRKLRLSPLSGGAQRGILIAMIIMCLLGASVVVALYGCASAILGSRGVLQQRAQNQDKNGRPGGEE